MTSPAFASSVPYRLTERHSANSSLCRPSLRLRPRVVCKTEGSKESLEKQDEHSSSIAPKVTGIILAAAAIAALSAASLSNAAGSNDTLDSGAKLFEMNCAGCHPGGGNIIATSRGKTLRTKALEKYGFDNKESIVSLMRAGKGAMPNYSNKLSDEQLDDISQFVLDQAKVNWK